MTGDRGENGGWTTSGRPSETSPLLGSVNAHGRSDILITPGGPTSSVQKTFSNIVVSIVGAGVLGMPYTFKQSGWLCGSLALAFVGVACYHNMMLLVSSKKRVESVDNDGVESYSELGYVTYGAAGEFAVDLMILLSQGGFCVAYLIFIGENLASVFAGVDQTVSPPDLDEGLNWQAKAIYIWLLFPFQVWLASIRSLARLAPFSIFADVANFLAMAVVMQKDVFQLYKHGIPTAKSFTGWSSVPFVVGVAIYAFEGFGLVLPIESNMKDRSKFGATLGTALAAITTLFIIFASLGYFAFGESTKDIITLNLGRSWQTSIIKTALCFGLFFTFPVMMLPVHEVVERRFRSSFILRSLTVLLVAWTAAAVPHFGDFLSLIGSSVCCVLSFVFPALFHLRTHKEDLRPSEIYLDYTSVAFGVVFGIWGTFSALKNW